MLALRTATKAPPLEARLVRRTPVQGENAESRAASVPTPVTTGERGGEELGAGVVGPAGENMGLWTSLGLRVGERSWEQE